MPRFVIRGLLLTGAIVGSVVWYRSTVVTGPVMTTGNDIDTVPRPLVQEVCLQTAHDRRDGAVLESPVITDAVPIATGENKQGSRRWRQRPTNMILDEQGRLRRRVIPPAF